MHHCIRRLSLRPRLLAAALALPFAAQAGEITLAAGTTSWVVPAGVTAINVVATGGGGGGGVGGNGGAGGQVTVTNWLVTPGSTLQVAIGSGGAGLVIPESPAERNGLKAEPEPGALQAFGGHPTSLQNGSEWIIAGGGGGGGIAIINADDVDVSGGDGCGSQGMGPLFNEISVGGKGGTNGQGGANGMNHSTDSANFEVLWGAAGGSGQGVSQGGVGTSLNNDFYAGEGGGGWGGGGGGGLLFTVGGLTAGSAGGGGGGGSTGDNCVPASNGGLRIQVPTGETPPENLTTRLKAAAAKAGPTNFDGGPGSLTISYADPISATLGGNVSGLSAAGLVLASGGYPVQTITPAVNATSFTFADAVAGPYAVTVQTQPAGLQCTVGSGTGTITADVNNVVVSCVPAAGATPTPVPSLGALGVLMLSGLLGWLGMRRRS
ncbi:MAG: hypothetical protein RSF42_00725 [Comamonas sp.]